VSAGKPIALLVAKSLIVGTAATALAQPSDLDLPTGRFQGGPVDPAALPPVAPSAPAVPGASPLDLPTGTLPSVAPGGTGLLPVVPDALLDAVPGKPNTPPPSSLLPADAASNPAAIPDDLAASNGGLGVFSPLWEGVGTQRTVFSPAYVPSYSYLSPEPTKYNPYHLNWGPLKGRLYGAVQFEYNDNISLGDKGSRVSDFYITPNVGVGFEWLLAQGQALRFDLGLGYRWYLKHSELNSVIITPSTHARFDFRVGPVKMNVHDSFTTSIDPLTQAQVGATTVNTNALLNYRRIINTLGIGADWQASRYVGVQAGYDWKIDRSFTDQLRFVDHDEHTFSGGVYAQPTPRLRVGLNGAYTIVDYRQNIQNNATIWSIGPSAEYKITDQISVNGSVGYTATSFDKPSLANTNSVADTSNFRSIAYQAGVNHRFSPQWYHGVSVSRGASLGIGNNFADHTAVQYGIVGQVAAPLTLQATFTWEDIKVSGLAGEKANRYIFYLGARYRLTQAWNAGLGYSYALKDSNVPGADYYQNRVTLDLTRQF
jgi:hypothetical protein